MTLIVGVLCSDGAVIGADGAVSLGSPIGGLTVRQDTKKLTIVGDKCVIGTSGPVGLSQRFAHELEGLVADGKLFGLGHKKSVAVGVEIGTKFRIHITPVEVFPSLRLTPPVVSGRSDTVPSMAA